MLCAALQVKCTTCKLLQTVTCFKFSLFVLWSRHDLFFFLLLDTQCLLFVVGSFFFNLYGISESLKKKIFFYDFTIFSGSSFSNVYSPLGSGKLRRKVLHT